MQAFSHDGKSQTIRAKQPDKEKTIGRVYKKELSFTDVKIVNLMYNCAGKSKCILNLKTKICASFNLGAMNANLQ